MAPSTDAPAGPLRRPLASAAWLHLVVALQVIAAIGWAACAPTSAPTASPRTLVVTSVTVLGDLIRQVAGDKAEVRALVPSGADPSTFQPAAREVLTISRAALIFFNGRGLDRTLRNLVANAGLAAPPVHYLPEGLPSLGSPLLSPEPGATAVPPGGAGNPYLWLDPTLAAAYVQRIRAGLVQIDPGNEQEYVRNELRYLDRLQRLDAELAATLASIPAERRKLVTLHDAFPYFAARYGFDIVAVAIRTPGREPTAREIAEVSTALIQHRVDTVFTEPQLNARLLKLAARDAGKRLSTLYSDTLDHTVTSYESLLRYNARQLVSGLT